MTLKDAYKEVMHNDMVVILYDYIGLIADKNQIMSDLEQGFLYKVDGNDGHTYIRFEDEFNDVAIRVCDGEITYNTQMLFDDVPGDPQELSDIATTTYKVGDKWRVDITEDAEMYEAWLYYDGCGHKAYMWGEPKVQSNGSNPTRDGFMQRVFSLWTDYITGYLADIGYMESGYMDEH